MPAMLEFLDPPAEGELPSRGRGEAPSAATRVPRVLRIVVDRIAEFRREQQYLAAEGASRRPSALDRPA
jgi:hypothetical protein